MQDRVRRAFAERWEAEPAWIVRAPGRVNLIGEHTDYNDGFVLPVAIDRAAWIALRPRPDRQVVLYALDLGEMASFGLDALEHGDGWAEYVKGVVWALQEAGHALTGWEGVLASNVPIGAGLSSSAALELAAMRAFGAISDMPWAPKTMARLGQRAENEWVGVQCGIMDQMIAAAGQAGHALLIDCRSLDTAPVPLPPETAIVVMDTGTRRGLVDSAYNERRRQCEAAAAYFSAPTLRDVDEATFEAEANNLDPVIRRRARHVVMENARTLAAAEVLRAGDSSEMGRLMNAGHASLRDDFEVSSLALDAMVEAAQLQPGCYGARMTGAGFGGCAVALVRADAASVFVKSVAAEYERVTGNAARLYACRASEGACVIR